MQGLGLARCMVQGLRIESVGVQGLGFIVPRKLERRQLGHDWGFLGKLQEVSL